MTDLADCFKLKAHRGVLRVSRDELRDALIEEIDAWLENGGRYYPNLEIRVWQSWSPPRSAFSLAAEEAMQV